MITLLLTLAGVRLLLDFVDETSPADIAFLAACLAGVGLAVWRLNSI